jgi:hypothetical protein
MQERASRPQVEIMMSLEEKFDITLDEEGAEKISNVQEAADMIASQVSAVPAVHLLCLAVP